MYKKSEHIHFMGIGGIGMSGIAEIVKHRGYTVSGCDLGNNSKTLDHLRAIGCTIYQGHDHTHINSADVLVYSSAVKQSDPEIVAGYAKGIPVIQRALMLGELMRTKYSVAVSGVHGKTTTTSLISHIMLEADKNPTVVIGGVLKNIANNAQAGSGEILIAEADESDRSLLQLAPTMTVVTNIDNDHLDVYKDIEDIKDTFKQFISHIPFYGKSFVCIDDLHIRSMLPLPHVPIVTYGLSQDADIMGTMVQLDKASSTLEVYTAVSTPNAHHKEQRLLGTVHLSIPGKHNVLNALAAIGVCLEFDIPFIQIAQALATFKGVERRFEFKGSYNGADVFDDYGHHPTEIKVTLEVAKRRTKKCLHVVFEPHRFSRTQTLWQEFVDLFTLQTPERCHIDTLFIADVYAASEVPIDGITAQILVQAMQQANPSLNIQYISGYQSIAQALRAVAQEDDLVLTIGAGKVYQVGEDLVKDFFVAAM